MQKKTVKRLNVAGMTLFASFCLISCAFIAGLGVTLLSFGVTLALYGPVIYVTMRIEKRANDHFREDK